MRDILTIHVEGRKVWDDDLEIFTDIPESTLILKHTLESIADWEAKWKRAYLREGKKTFEQTLDYIVCMTQNGPFPDEVYAALSDTDILRIADYIDEPMSATWFPDSVLGSDKKGPVDVVTNELVYYWMTVYNIPPQYATWHFNHLMALIKMCSVKSQKPKKMSAREIAQRNHALNEARKAKYHTRG